MEEKTNIEVLQENMEALSQRNKQLQEKIAELTSAYDSLSAFRDLITHLNTIVTKGREEYPNYQAFYNCIMEADKALGYIKNPNALPF